MTTPMKLFVFLWIIMVLRVAGAFIGGRQCLRIRHVTRFRQLYEWFTAFGIGMIMWGAADLGIIWNSVANGLPNRDLYPSKTLWVSIGFQLLESGAVWIITLVLLNGAAPGFIRRSIFWMLSKVRIMDFADPVQDPRPNLPNQHTTEP